MYANFQTVPLSSDAVVNHCLYWGTNIKRALGFPVGVNATRPLLLDSKPKIIFTYRTHGEKREIVTYIARKVGFVQIIAVVGEMYPF